jgi:hypothetical protein
MNALPDPIRQTVSNLSAVRRLGARESARRAVSRLGAKLGASETDFPIFPSDVSDSRALDLAVPATRLAADRTATIGWICTPPAAGSGGHTTLFRMVAELERRGHRSVIYFYDRYNSDFDERVRILRSAWPNLTSEIRSIDDGFDGVDAVVASSWQSAHALAARSATVPMHRFYFIQDYEPYFYPRGWLYELAEDTYRFGFTNIALGGMISGVLDRELDVPSKQVEFGRDTETYRLTNTGAREGVVFYERPSSDRRGFELARLALEEFHRRHPEQPIHLYGAGGGEWSIPVVRHGRLTPAQLNTLYNESIAGLAMSFTNVSLVPDELLLSGAIPVVNDSPLARACLSHPEVVWAAATPGALADALSRTVENSDPARPERAAAGDRPGWAQTENAVAELIEDAVFGGSPVSRRESALPAEARR